MLFFEWNPIIWVIAFIALLLISKYAIEQMPSWFWITLFLIISYVQGIIFVFTFNIPIKFFDYFENMFVPIPVSVMFGIFYFVLFLALLNIYKTFSNTSKKQFEDLPDNEVKDYIANIWNLPTEQIKIISYDDGNCPNVQREISHGKLVIHVGKNFMKLVNKSEMLFTLSHEVAHFKGHNYQFVFCFFCFLYIVFTCVISQFIVSMMVLNAFSFILITFILFIVGLMTIHYIQWHEEYSADYNGGTKLKDVQNFESFFQINELVQNDHGWFCDLVFFDHPSSKRRLKNIQKLKDKT
jgi:Zn-dependent protease with chaperone function